MNISIAPLLVAIIIFLSSCSDNHPANDKLPPSSPSEGTFGYDLDFLRQHDSVVVLTSGEAAVIVSPKYQGKVFTSTADGDKGKSFGWINYKAFTAPLDSHMNAYGGENRFWLGPEGGPYSLFFPKGAGMTFPNWKTPAPVDTESWLVKSKEGRSVQLQKNMALTNYAGAQLQLSVDRTIAVLERKNIEALLSSALDNSVKAVGYKTTNTITNTGKEEWTEKTGVPCIWMLDMFRPSPSTAIVVPYEQNVANNEKVATTNYFGEISLDRVKYANGLLFFKADGKSRGKLGIGPHRAKPFAGSYDASANVLTLIVFDVDKNGRYLNQEWTTTKPPFSGDAVNAYNDGPLQDGKQLGPFYELESVSPAAFLKPGASIIHNHSVFHFTGSKAALNQISKNTLGASLEAIQIAFQ